MLLAPVPLMPPPPAALALSLIAVLAESVLRQDRDTRCASTEMSQVPTPLTRTVGAETKIVSFWPMLTFTVESASFCDVAPLAPTMAACVRVDDGFVVIGVRPGQRQRRNIEAWRCHRSRRSPSRSGR